MLSNEDKNEIIEMLRCPECKGSKTVLPDLILVGAEISIECKNCNGTGIRLPENVEEKQLKEQSEDVIQLKFKINQLENSLAEKDKEIAELQAELEAERDKYERADLLVYLRDDFECVYFPEIINAIEMFDAVVKVESIANKALKDGE